MEQTRRELLGGIGAAGLSLALPCQALAAAPFRSARFSVEVGGKGRELIFIPGLAASRSVWRGTVAALPGYRCHTLQLGGFAGEPVGGNARGRIVAGVAEDLARYIGDRRIERPAVVGHSMGGAIGLMLAARYPSQVGRLMVVDMMPQPSRLLGASPRELRGIADNLRGLSTVPGGRALVATLLAMFGDGQRGAPASDQDVVARAVHELAEMDLAPELARIVAPLTVVYAVQDPARRQALDRAFASAYRSKPGVRLVRIDRSGHMVMADQPAKFREAMRAFLAG